jgi:cytosine/creatinine deaminase
LDQIIRGVRLRGREGSFDVAIEGEAIAAVEESIEGGADHELDGQGCLLSPGFVNIHVHLDKCMLGEVMRPNESQTLQEAIEITWDHKRSYTVEEIADRASPVVDQGIVNGTTAVRAFADVDTIGGTTPVEGLLELKRRFERETTFEVVAFPQEGIIRDPGCEKLMEECMELGADVVGGLPWYERTDRHMWEHIDFCFELARRTGKDIHMLVDDTDDPNSRSLEYLALRTLAEGYGGRVVASHCGALGAYDHTYAEKVIGMVREAGVTISSNTQISLVMDGHTDRGLVRRGITRVGELLEAGVNVVSAQDDVNDPYYPFGKPDQLEVGQYTAHVAHLTYPSHLETVFDMITANAARAMRLEGYGLEPGNRADLVLIEARSAHEAMRLIPPRRAVLYGGRLVAESSSENRRHRLGA